MTVSIFWGSVFGHGHKIIQRTCELGLFLIILKTWFDHIYMYHQIYFWKTFKGLCIKIFPNLTDFITFWYWEKFNFQFYFMCNSFFVISNYLWLPNFVVFMYLCNCCKSICQFILSCFQKSNSYAFIWMYITNLY